MNRHVVEKSSGGRRKKDRYLRLSDLSVEVMLDHAGGHDTWACHRALGLRSESRNERKGINDSRSSRDLWFLDTNSAPIERSEWFDADYAFQKLLLTSPTKKHDNKLYIRLNDFPSKAAPPLSPKKENSEKKPSVKSGIKTDTALNFSPLYLLRRATVLPRTRRRNSTGNMPPLPSSQSLLMPSRSMAEPSQPKGKQEDSRCSKIPSLEEMIQSHSRPRQIPPRRTKSQSLQRRNRRCPSSPLPRRPTQFVSPKNHDP